VPFTQGPLFSMLRNHFYLGEVKFKGEILPGSQPALLDRTLFEAVQQRLTEQWSHRTTTRIRTRALLAGLLFDDAGHRMILTYASRDRVRHRYYVSAPCIRGQTDEPVGSVTRVPASEIEATISKAVMANTDIDERLSNDTLSRETLERFVTRIEVRKNQLVISLRSDGNDNQGIRSPHDLDPAEYHEVTSRNVIVPWKKPSKPAREILLPANTPEHRARPMKAERRSALIRSIGRGRHWFQEVVDGRETIESLAARQHCSTRHITLTLSLAFLAPTLVSAAVEGRLPRGIGVAALRDAPAEWSQQMTRLGLAPTDAPDSANR
jgi:site-specific DNA recombinase